MSDAPITPGIAAETPAQTTTNTVPSEPDLMNMTGEQAVAYVKAQKEKAANPTPNQPKKESIPAAADLAKEVMKKYKVKIDGKDEEVEESELIRGYGHQKAANKLLQEGKRAKEEAMQFINLMKDPNKLFEAITKLGHDPLKLSEQFIVNHLNEESMDPRDKELRDARNKLKQIDDMEKEQQKRVESQRLDELKSKFAQEYESNFIEALKSSGLPQTKPMVAEMAKYISRSAKIGFEMSPSEAAQLVREDIQASQLALYGNSDGDTLLKLLGDDAANKILQARGSKIKQPDANLRTPVDQGPLQDRKSNNGNSRMTQAEWRKFNRK